jgi:Viral coat protein (S domain)
MNKREATGMTFTNSECLGALSFSIAGGQTFAMYPWTFNTAGPVLDNRLLLSPNNYALCPWLANIAKLFEHYRWISLRIRLVSQSQMIPNNVFGAGIVSGVISYDPLDPAFTTCPNMYNYDGSVMSKPTSDIIIQMDPGRVSSNRPFFYTTTWPPSFTDASLRDYCPAWLQIAIDGMPNLAGAATYSTHVVWVDYTVQFAVNKNAPV